MAQFLPGNASCALGVLAWLTFAGAAAPATILWSDIAARVVHKTARGTDLLAGAVKRDDTANDELYFRFHVDPLSDVASEEYFAAFQLFLGNTPKLAVGNAPEAWGYSAFYTSETGPSNRVAGEYNLKSSKPEGAALGVFRPYELPRHGQERTIIFKVQYVPGGDDLITVWLSPDFSRGATDKNQPEALTTRFKADASFDQIRLIHEGGGNGWIFSDMAIATSFNDFVILRFWQTWWFMGVTAAGLLAAVGVGARLAERRKYQLRLRLAEQEHALERERSRIAQDLHDDLGSSLARISLLSGLAQADQGKPAQLESHVRKIAEAANETVRALEEIVWAVRPGSDSLQSLVEYIAHFASELFEAHSTRCRLDLPPDLPAVSLPPEVRHNIFLVVKEALTNVLKHAHAAEVLVQAKASGKLMEFSVADNGRGFDSAQVSLNTKGNGLSNMQRRAETMRGQATVDSSPRGTTVRLVVNVARE